MTLQHKNWLKDEISGLYLSGESQENIANKLNMSAGTVKNLVCEILKSDNTSDLQQQIAICSKESGVNIKQLAANLRWKKHSKTK